MAWLAAAAGFQHPEDRAVIAETAMPARAGTMGLKRAGEWDGNLFV